MSEEREIIRCGNPDCKLNQFKTGSGLCRRCNTPYPEKPIEEPTPEEIPLLPVVAIEIPRSSIKLDRVKMNRKMAIGRRLYELRSEKRLTQQGMATKAGVPRTYISRIENGRILPGPVMLRRFSDALGISMLDFLPPTHTLEIGKDPYWNALSAYLSELGPEQVGYVLEYVHGLLTPIVATGSINDSIPELG